MRALTLLPLLLSGALAWKLGRDWYREAVNWEYRKINLWRLG